jgi:hypothetical protein
MRDCFNVFHRFIGTMAFFASSKFSFLNIFFHFTDHQNENLIIVLAAALCNALFIERISLGWQNVGIIMGWLLWLFLIFLVLEILKFFDDQYLIQTPFPDTYPNEIHNRFDKIRLILLVFHVIISFGVGIASIVFIAKANVTAVGIKAVGNE